MASSRKPISNGTANKMERMSYSDYTKDALRDLPPSLFLADACDSSNTANNNNIQPSMNLDNKIIKDILSNNSSNTTTVLNVSGSKIEVNKTIYAKLEPVILSGETTPIVQINSMTGSVEIFIDRHPACFTAILDYYRFGELHMPNDVCPSLFKRELWFWGLESKCMAVCCLRRYSAFHSNEEVLTNCTLFGIQNNGRQKQSGIPTTKWGRFRDKGWAVLDNPKSSALAKVYLVLASFFVVLSVFLLAASTDSNFMRELTSDEWEDIMSDDELYTYWESIYPGVQKPPRNGGGGGSSAPNNVGKRSIPDEQLNDQYWTQMNGYEHLVGQRREMETDNDKKLEQKDKTIRHVSGSNEFGENVKQEETVESELRFSSERLSRYVTQTVKGILKHIPESKQSGRVKQLSKVIVDRAMLGHKKRMRNVDNIQIHQDKDKGEYYDLEYPGRLSSHGGDGDDKDDDGFSGQNEALHNLKGRSKEHANIPNFSNIILDISNHRQRRSATTYNTTSNRTETIYSSACVYTSGSELKSMIDAATMAAASMIALGMDEELPTAHAPQDWMTYLDTMCMTYFTIEFIVRLIFAPSKLNYLFSFLTLMDLISLVTMYVNNFITMIDPIFKYTPSFWDAINCMQIARVFRLFRLVKDVIGFRVLVLSVRTSWRELLLLFLYIIMAVTIFSTLIFFCERENMGSIPDAAWWAVVTMTTVGYGDMTPKTLQGRLTGMACAVSGVLLIAVTVPVFVNNFILFYEQSKISLELQDSKNEQNKDGDETKKKINESSNRERQSNTESEIFTSERYFRGEKNGDFNGSKMTHVSDSDVYSMMSSPTATSNQSFELDRLGDFERGGSRKSLIRKTSTDSLSQPHTYAYSTRGQSKQMTSTSLNSAVSASKVTPYINDLENEVDVERNTSPGMNKPLHVLQTKEGAPSDRRNVNLHSQKV